MTEKELRNYRALCREIASLQRRILLEDGRDVDVIAGKVRASMKDFPYIEIRVGVEMEEPEAAAARDRLVQLYKERKDQAEKKKLEIEEYINGIDDPELRLIFQYRYIDGKTQGDIAAKLNMDRSVVSRRISTHIKICTQNTK